MAGLFSANPVLWRVLLLRRNASEFLVFEARKCVRLPEVEVAAGSRTAKSLNSSIREMWKFEVFSLYQLPVASAPVNSFYVVEVLQHDAEAPAFARWLRLDEARGRQFCDPSDLCAVDAYIDALSLGRETRHGTPFKAPGWFFECKDWTRAALRSVHLTLTDRFVQCNASPSFSLIRFETDGSAVWFKAVGEPNLREYALTVFLSSKLASHLPRILETKPEWHAWLALEADGVPLSQTNELPFWRQAVRDLAAMQKESVDLTDGLLRSGARDVRTSTLLSQIDLFLPLVRELMARQLQERPLRLTESEIDLLGEELRSAFEFLSRDGTPDSILHLDLHPDNVIALTGKTVFLDWAEGAVGHPFLSFAYFVEHFRRQFANSDHGLDILAREYLAVWNQGACRDNESVLSFCALAALFAHAVSTGIDRDKILRDHHLSGYYRSLARRMKRYGERARSQSASFREVIA